MLAQEQNMRREAEERILLKKQEQEEIQKQIQKQQEELERIISLRKEKQKQKAMGTFINLRYVINTPKPQTFNPAP